MPGARRRRHKASWLIATPMRLLALHPGARSDTHYGATTVKDRSPACQPPNRPPPPLPLPPCTWPNESQAPCPITSRSIEENTGRLQPCLASSGSACSVAAMALRRTACHTSAGVGPAPAGPAGIAPRASGRADSRRSCRHRTAYCESVSPGLRCGSCSSSFCSSGRMRGRAGVPIT